MTKSCTKLTTAHLAGVSGLVDAAAAEELRGRLVELSRQVVDLQVAVAQKDAQLAHLQQHQTTLQARLAAVGVSVPVPPPVAPVAPPVGLTQEASMAGSAGGYPAQHAAHQQQLGGAAVAEEVAALREQLVEALEELDARERELSEVRPPQPRWTCHLGSFMMHNCSWLCNHHDLLHGGITRSFPCVLICLHSHACRCGGGPLTCHPLLTALSHPTDAGGLWPVPGQDAGAARPGEAAVPRLRQHSRQLAHGAGNYAKAGGWCTIDSCQVWVRARTCMPLVCALQQMPVVKQPLLEAHPCILPDPYR